MKKIGRRIAINVFEKTLTATAWIFEALAFLGIGTIEAFLNPSYYADMPSFYWENSKPVPRKKPTFKELTIRQSIWRLEKQGFVEKKEGKYILTEYGKKLARFILQRKKVLNKKWDGKFRVVIFDIPEDKSNARDWFRRELMLLQYRKLQKSVFIGKIPLPEDLIKEIKRLKIGNCVNYIFADKVYKNII